MRTRILLFVAAVLTMHVCAPSAGAWARLAHRVTSKIACDVLTPEASAAVQTILGQEHCADIGMWADEQQEIPLTGPWHYVNIPITANSYDPKYCPRGGCVVAKIEVLKQVLRDPHAGIKQKQIALKFLVHLITDLHNPMHVGDNNDKGGNLLPLRFFSEETNLHRVWDVQLIEKHSTDEERWLQEIRQTMNQKNIGEWSKAKTVVDWTNESLELSKKAYRFPDTGMLLKPGAKLDMRYYRFAYPRVREQLAKAAYRVSRTLNEIFQ
jgi:hypothetical protein